MERAGWVSRLWLHVSEREEGYVPIYNLSISGGTTETILRRFENEAKIRNADAIIFQTGGNDASFKEVSGENLVSLEKFRANVEEIITRAKKITSKIIFTDLKNCDESKTTPVYWADIYYTNDNIRKYSEAMKEVCGQNEVLFLEVGHLENEDFDDGLHPNASGHEKIFIKVRDFLTEQGWI